MEQALLIIFQVVLSILVVAAWVSLAFLVIPGCTIIWAISVVYILVTGFNPVSIAILIFETLLMVIGNTVDQLLMGGSAKAQGASWWSIAAAIVGAIAGSALLPPLGGLLGAPILLFLAELAQNRNLEKSWKSLVAMVTGFGWAVVTRMIVGAIMGFWFYALIFFQAKGWV